MPCGAKTDQEVLCMLFHSHGSPMTFLHFFALYDYKQEIQNLSLIPPYRLPFLSVF